MRYREQSADGDYVFIGTSPFLIDSPAAVAQAIKTRLRLVAGEWFLDDRIGFDLSKVLGNNTQNTRDLEARRVIVNTPGVLSLVSYSSQVNERRRFTIQGVVDTIYGRVTISEAL